MVALPSPTVLASLVSNVTETMLGISFQPDGGPRAISELLWRTAVLPILGTDPVIVGLSSDERGCIELTSKMFACKPAEVDASMAEDALRELLNMTAGLVKSTLGLNQALGLPRIFVGAQASPTSKQIPDTLVVLKAKDLGIVLWVNAGLLDAV